MPASKRGAEFLRVKAQVDAIYEKWKSAETDDERMRARQDMAEAERQQKRYPWALDPVRQELSWERATRVVALSPLLRARWIPLRGASERLFAGSEDGGTYGDSRSEPTSVSVLYEYAPRAADKKELEELLSGGAILVEVTYVPSGSSAEAVSPPRRRNRGG